MSEQKGTRPPLDCWAVVELMGHTKLAGHVLEEERFGTKLGRIEIPQKDGSFVTQYFGGSSLFRLTPVSEEVARSVAMSNAYLPIHSWELPKPALTHQTEVDPNPERHERSDTGDDYRDDDDDYDPYDPDDDEPAF